MPRVWGRHDSRRFCGGDPQPALLRRRASALRRVEPQSEEPSDPRRRDVCLLATVVVAVTAVSVARRADVERAPPARRRIAQQLLALTAGNSCLYGVWT